MPVYQVLEDIGEGSFGVVKLAYNTETEEKVAIKISTKEHIQREFNILRSLRHPNIIQAKKLIVNVPPELCSKDSYQQGFIMNFIEGGDLVDFLASHEKGLPEKQALKFLRQILSAVHYLHKKGIAHRDIKPDNLLVDKKNEIVVLADFGLAVKCDPNKLECGRTGSLAYCAPEILRDVSYEATSADIWSLGVVFYCMLSGYLPWEGENLTEQLQRAMSGQYPKVDGISLECQELLEAMLVVNPKYRSTARKLLKKLDAWMNTQEQCVADEDYLPIANLSISAAGTTQLEADG